MFSPKLCILMWYDYAIREYADINFEINKIYCSKHGHDIIRSDKKTFRYKPAQWERLPLILEYIQNYDYVMYIDSDAHFYIDAPDIMTIITQYSDKAFIFSGDVNQKHDFELNSGVFIVKNCSPTTARSAFNPSRALLYLPEADSVTILNSRPAMFAKS